MTTKTIRLTKEHTHAGKNRQVGDEILMSADDAAWAIARDIGYEVGTDAAANMSHDEIVEIFKAKPKPITRTTAAPARRASCCGGRW